MKFPVVRVDFSKTKGEAQQAGAKTAVGESSTDMNRLWLTRCVIIRVKDIKP
jgi:hypothetical protein